MALHGRTGTWSSRKSAGNRKYVPWKMDKYKKGPAVDLAAMNRDAEAVFEKWHLPKVPLDVPAGTLSIEQRKIMELARA